MLIKKDKTQSIDQLSIAKIVATRLGLDLNTVIAVIDMEQKTTMTYIKRGFKVTKKNYLVMEPKLMKGYNFTSAINGEEYEIPNRVRISIRIGEGFKSYVNDNSKMANRLCRFVEQK